MTPLGVCDEADLHVYRNNKLPDKVCLQNEDDESSLEKWIRYDASRNQIQNISHENGTLSHNAVALDCNTLFNYPTPCVLNNFPTKSIGVKDKSNFAMNRIMQETSAKNHFTKKSTEVKAGPMKCSTRKVMGTEPDVKSINRRCLNCGLDILNFDPCNSEGLNWCDYCLHPEKLTVERQTDFSIFKLSNFLLRKTMSFCNFFLNFIFVRRKNSLNSFHNSFASYSTLMLMLSVVSISRFPTMAAYEYKLKREPVHCDIANFTTEFDMPQDFLIDGKVHPLTFAVSHRPSHQLLTEVVATVLMQKLGYRNIEIHTPQQLVQSDYLTTPLARELVLPI